MTSVDNVLAIQCKPYVQSFLCSHIFHNQLDTNPNLELHLIRKFCNFIIYTSRTCKPYLLTCISHSLSLFHSHLADVTCSYNIKFYFFIYSKRCCYIKSVCKNIISQVKIILAHHASSRSHTDVCSNI